MFDSKPLSLSPTASRHRHSPLFVAAALVLAALAVVRLTSWVASTPALAPANAQTLRETCSRLHAKPGPPHHFHRRQVSDRFEPGTPPTIIRNATLWTGARNGTEVVFGDLLLDGGIIKAVGYLPNRVIEKLGYDSGFFNVIDANGAWVTPGLFDLHSHMGVLSTPFMFGAIDGNSPNGPIVPWLRSVDGINTRDDSFRLTVAGGVIGGLILPGSGNMIGGQAFPIKYRRTPQRTPLSMVIDPPYGLNASDPWMPGKPLRWRHMKHATGENQIRYGTRMDTGWTFRNAYNTAKKIKESQDRFCAKVDAELWNDPEMKERKFEFPNDLQWEALVDVLRGRVKVNCHTYETVDIDFLQRLTTEFEFPLAAIHHAHEAYLVPDLLKKMWGGPPTVAIFAVLARYKRESYRGSEFAAKILSDNGINVVMKSDHPVVNSRYLAFEAQQAHYYGLQTALALSSVITTPARAAGLDHRLGHILEGYDADIVLWDSHPLTLGATPKQVWIDGIPQIDDPKTVGGKGEAWQRAPLTPDWSKEIKKTLDYDGLPPLEADSGKRVQGEKVVFGNVCEVWMRDSTAGAKGVKNVLGGVKREGASAWERERKNSTIVLINGKIICVSPPPSSPVVFATSTDCLSSLSPSETHTLIDLKCGSLSIGLTTWGSALGLAEIEAEGSTTDGPVFAPLWNNIPKIYNDTGGAANAEDGLMFGGRDTLLAYRAGVTTAIAHPGSAPTMGLASIFEGTSVVFRTGAAHGLEEGAIVKSLAALHLGFHHTAELSRDTTAPSVSSQIANVRRLLLHSSEYGGRTERLFWRVAKGELPLIISVDNRDIMVSLIKVKRDVEKAMGVGIKLAFNGAAEAHLIAEHIAAAGVKVIVTPSHSFPMFWDMKRLLPGPPLSKYTPITALLSKNVTVAIGSADKSIARNVMLEVAWAALDSGWEMGKEEALALASTSLFDIFDVDQGDPAMEDLVAWEGDMFSFEGRVVAIASPQRGVVDVL